MIAHRVCHEQRVVRSIMHALYVGEVVVVVVAHVKRARLFDGAACMMIHNTKHNQCVF